MWFLGLSGSLFFIATLAVRIPLQNSRKLSQIIYNTKCLREGIGEVNNNGEFEIKDIGWEFSIIKKKWKGSKCGL